MLRLAINGYGRIGRSVLRALYESHLRHDLSVVAINELADAGTVLHLTRYDSTHGRFPLPLDGDSKRMRVDGDAIALLNHSRIDDLPWETLGVDIVLECTGAFSDRTTAEMHLHQGAGKVLFSQPAQADVDKTVVYGVNHRELRATHRIASNAS
ncbi:MAG TPA: glyceraldehyde 3-phosphate dehydrogenase NAD-binding domain-containing protein, partial [Halioglobus sp.]